MESSPFKYSHWNNLGHVYPWCKFNRASRNLSGLNPVLFGFICNTNYIRSSEDHTRTYFCKNVFVCKTTETPWKPVFSVVHIRRSAFIIQKLTIKENLLYFLFVALEEMFESCHLPWKSTTTLTFKEHKSFLKVGVRLASYSTALEDCVLSSNMK